MPFDAITQTGMTYARFRTWRQGQKDNGFYSVPFASSVGGNMALTPGNMQESISVCRATAATM